MVALLYIATASILLALAHFRVTRITPRIAIALVILPLCFTARAVLTDQIYAPVEMAYLAQPLHDQAAELGVGKPHNGAVSDIAFQMLPWREATRRSLLNREWPLLNLFQSCGDVLAGAAQPAVYSPFTLIACLLPAPLSFTYTGVIAFFVAGFGAFLFARELGCSEIASLFAEAAWMFSGPVALQILWPHGFAWALLPLVMMATHRILHAPGARSMALLTWALTLELLAGHPETALHVIAISACYGLFELFSATNRLHAIAAALLSAILAVGISAVYLLPFLEAATQTREYLIRTLAYAPEPLRVSPGFVRDVLLGDPFPWLRTPSGRLPEDIAAGSIAIALAIYSVALVRTGRTWFFVGVFAVGLLVGAKAWPLAHMLHALPLFDVTLNERLATACPLAVAMLAAFAIDRLDAKSFTFAVAVLLVIDVVVAITLPRPEAGLPRLYADVIPLVICLGAVRIKPLVPLLLALLIAQRVVSDGSLIPVNDHRIAYPRLALFDPMNEVKEPFRIAASGSTLIPNTATLYGLEDVRGNAPMTLHQFAETFPLWSTIGAGQFHSIPDLTKPILSMMNVRFALTSVNEPVPAAWREVKRERSTRLIENERVLPRAFIPRNVRFGSEHEIDEMSAANDFAERAWLRASEPRHDRVNGGGIASSIRTKNGLRIDVMKEGDGFVVISQSAWKGYRAYVDGKRVALQRANHAFLAAFVPNGRHTIDLRYVPQSFVVGRAITLLTLALYSTVTLLARLRGWSTSQPRRKAM